MNRSINSSCLRPIAIFIFITAILAGAGSAATAADRTHIWQSRDQFVALEPREGGVTGQPAANDHPAVMTADQITALLGSLRLRADGDGSAAPLFTGETLQTLAPELVLALSRANAGEDVTFAVIGLHEALLGLAKQPRVTTGRIFIENGRFNLIVGLAQSDVNEYADRRLHPFNPGERYKPSPGRWQIIPLVKSEGVVTLRHDWIAALPGWSPVTVTEPADVKSAPTKGGSGAAERLTIIDGLLKKGLISEEEFRDKRREILRGI